LLLSFHLLSSAAYSLLHIKCVYRGLIEAADNETARDPPLGMWFFDSARTIKQHFNLDDSFSTVYLADMDKFVRTQSSEQPTKEKQ